MRKLLPLLAICFLFLGFDDALAPWQDRPWETYIRAQKKAQVAYHHLVRMHLHDLRKTIEKSQEMQLAIADQQSARFYYLKAHHPEKIIRNGGFAGFVHFPWNEELEANLKTTDKEFQKREKRIEKLKKKLDNNPDFERIRDKLDELVHSSESDRIRARFRFIQKEVEEQLML